MDFDVCYECHRHIDHTAVDEAYPHLSERHAPFPPEGMSFLEEDIFWGRICVDCARTAGMEPTRIAEVQNVPVPSVRRRGNLRRLNLRRISP